MPDVLGLLLFLGTALLLLVGIMSSLLARDARRPPRHTAGFALAHGLPCDPGDLSVPFESWDVDRPGDVQLPAWEIDGNGESGRSAVFVHGWGHSRIDLLTRLDADRAFWLDRFDRIVLYDLRGHGDATGRDERSRLGAGEGDDLAALIEQLGETSVVLVGHSMGAVIAIAAAASARDASIDAVVAYAPYDDFHTSLRGRLGSRGLPARPLTDIAMVWFRFSGLRHRRTSDAAASLPCPLLVVHGSDDTVCPPAHGRRIAGIAPNGTYAEVDGAAHGDHHALDVERHAELVGGWLDDVLTPADQSSPEHPTAR